MAWQCGASSNAKLVDNLVKAGIIKSKSVEAAMRAVDRANYCPEKSAAYEDSPQAIGFNATISAPHMHAMCLEQLVGHLKNGAKVLDVGSGSGYLVAAMAQMIKPDGHVYGVEHIPELVEWSIANLARDDEKLKPNYTVLESDGRWGLADKGPFDAIHVGAAPAAVPEELKQQLKIGGRLVIPVGPAGNQSLVAFDRKSEKEWIKTTICGVMYVPLTTVKAQLKK